MHLTYPSFPLACFAITQVFSHAQTVVVCPSCQQVLCQPTGGKARLTEGAFAVIPCFSAMLMFLNLQVALSAGRQTKVFIISHLSARLSARTSTGTRFVCLVTRCSTTSLLNVKRRSVDCISSRLGVPHVAVLPKSASTWSNWR